jgi:general secretion pathway protein G
LNSRRQPGFTLIELVVTVAILGLLATMAVPFAELVQQRQKESELRDDLKLIRNAIDGYKQAVVDKRVDAAADASGYPPDLDTLWKGVPDKSKPDNSRIYFMRHLPRDPFASDKIGDAAESWGKRSYKSPPDDPQEGDDVYDVYSLSARTGLNGMPYRDW